MKKVEFRCPKCGCSELTQWIEGVSIEQRVEAIMSDGTKSYTRLDPHFIVVSDYNWDEWVERDVYKAYPLHYSCRQCKASVGSFGSADELMNNMEEKGWIIIKEGE